MDLRPYADLLAALLTPTIGITTAWIAIQQYRLAKERMRREFYDRRIIVYRGVIEVLSSIMTHGRIGEDDLTKWARATAEKAFLFDEDLCDYLESIRKQAVTAWAIEAQLEQVREGERRSELAKKEADLLLWLSEQLLEVQRRFTKYLRVA